MNRACEPCSRDDCDNCRFVGCVCCGDAQSDVPADVPTEPEYYEDAIWDDFWMDVMA